MVYMMGRLGSRQSPNPIGNWGKAHHQNQAQVIEMLTHNTYLTPQVQVHIVFIGQKKFGHIWAS